jgi:hypothetical protein
MRETRIGETITTAFRARGVPHVCVKMRHTCRPFHDVKEPRHAILLRISEMKKSFTRFPSFPIVPFPDGRLTFVSGQDHRPCLHTSGAARLVFWEYRSTGKKRPIRGRTIPGAVGDSHLRWHGGVSDASRIFAIMPLTDPTGHNVSQYFFIPADKENRQSVQSLKGVYTLS